MQISRQKTHANVKITSIWMLTKKIVKNDQIHCAKLAAMVLNVMSALTILKFH